MARMTKYMRPQIVEDDWIEIKTSHGACYLQKDVVGMPCGSVVLPEVPIGPAWNGTLVTKEYDPKLLDFLVDFYYIYTFTGSVASIEVIHGFGARLSAPGYLDSTDWHVFGTAEEALEHIKELRGE